MYKNLPKVDMPIVYFLHGFPNTPGIWQNQVADFKDTAELIMLQLPGVGSGNQALTSSYSLSKTIAFIGATVRQRKKDSPKRKVIFIGHDLGACILNEVASKYPDLADAQILINGGGIRQIGRRLFSWKQFKKSYYVGLFCLPYAPALICKFAKTLKDNLVYRFENPEVARSLRAESLNDFRAASLYRQFILRFIFGGSERFCQTKTTFVASKNDPFLVAPTKREMNKYFSRYEVLTLQSGHWSPYTEFKSINKIIRNTINTLEFAS